MKAKSAELFEKTKVFDDKVTKEEIHNILKVLAHQANAMNGEDLRLLRNYLRKLVY